MFDVSAFGIDASMKMNRAIAKNIVNTYAKGTVGPQQKVKALAESLEIHNPRKLATANENIVNEMLSRTRKSVADISARAKHYRAGQGRLVGGLGRAVNSKEFAYADAQGIYFANTDVLNREAKHWARLNFGAGKAAGPGNGVFRLRFDDRVIGPPVGFRDRPRPGFSMPAGLFTDGDGEVSRPRHEFSGKSTGNVFRPGAVTLVKTVTRGGPGPNETVRIKKRLPTVGIRARHFLDAGLRGLEAKFPTEYENYFEGQFKEGFQKAERIIPGQLFPL